MFSKVVCKLELHFESLTQNGSFALLFYSCLLFYPPQSSALNMSVEKWN